MEPPPVLDYLGRPRFLRLLLLICFIVSFVINNNNDNVGVEASHFIYPELQSLTTEEIQTVHKTGFHFQPSRNWLNDPNGPMYYNGYYHLFYQYNPKGAVWGNIVWAHSVSKDLINWEALEPALYPSKPFDVNGCWSGSATVLPDNTPIILYTGVDDKNNQVQNYAIPKNKSDPYLREWVKPDDNPIIGAADTSVNVSAFRDPTTAWFDGGHWKMVVGSKHHHRGIAHLYRSTDFKRWVKAHHPLHSKNGTGMWECPDFFPVGVNRVNGLDTSVLKGNVKHVFKVSLDVTRYEYYTLGTYLRDNDTYIPDPNSVDGWSGLRYDYGNFYASKSFFDPKHNRRILWGWANESDTAQDDVQKGWAGIQLVPRTILLDDSGKQLVQWPIKEIESLRSGKVDLPKRTLHSGDKVDVKGITAAQADVVVEFSFGSLETSRLVEPFDPSWTKLDPLDVCGLKGSTVQGGVGPFGLLTLASEKLEEYTPVFFRIFKVMDKPGKFKVLMCSDARSSSLKTGEKMYKPSFAGYVDNIDLSTGKLSLRSLIDHSVVESFAAGGKTCIASRVYPTIAVKENAHLFVFNNGSEPITVESLTAWSMNKPMLMNTNAPITS